MTLVDSVINYFVICTIGISICKQVHWLYNSEFFKNMSVTNLSLNLLIIEILDLRKILLQCAVIQHEQFCLFCFE